MRRLQTIHELRAAGVGRTERERAWTHVDRGVYVEGRESPTPLERALAAVVAARGVASGMVAAALYELDSVTVRGPDVTVPTGCNGHRSGVRRRNLTEVNVVQGIPCTTGRQTLLDLAPMVDDLVWEQILESALRKGLTSVDDIEAARSGVRGAKRIGRVLALRPAGAPATESLLETLFVQLVRALPGVPTPTRQREIHNHHGDWVARVDLAWPELGIFVELDGQHHAGQPVYDARRQTAVSAATGWLCGRFTWYEVTAIPRTTGRRVIDLVSQARGE